jgi:hypothetical protein
MGHEGVEGLTTNAALLKTSGSVSGKSVVHEAPYFQC